MSNGPLVYSGIRVWRGVGSRGVGLRSSKGATPDASLCLRNMQDGHGVQRSGDFVETYVGMKLTNRGGWGGFKHGTSPPCSS